MKDHNREFKIDGSWLNVDLAGGRLSILVPADDDHGPWDIEFIADEGPRYLGTVATLEDLRRLMETWSRTGECLNGRYLWIDDLIVVAKLSPGAIADMVEDLVRTGELASAMSLAEDDSD